PFRTIDNGGILSADIYAAQSLYDAYGGDTTDLRLKWYQIYDGGASPVVLCNKFPSATYFNVPRMRLAELLLIAAEANAETNNLTASHTALNSVRTRAAGKWSQRCRINSFNPYRTPPRTCHGGQPPSRAKTNSPARYT
ncbi:MAG TPA: RagB/SusD family nutrient uptake outer membrane protein, partial [Chitinophagales bacterium]|nr:RagB/SusD family nutrient uptake outer membrane protein [Chitinophagales bacterium]